METKILKMRARVFKIDKKKLQLFVTIDIQAMEMETMFVWNHEILILNLVHLAKIVTGLETVL